MYWQHAPYTMSLLVAAAVSAATGYYSWRRRDAPGSTMLAAMMLAVAVWALGYAFEIAESDLSAKVLWAKVEYLGIVTVPVAWLAFAFQYRGRERWLGPGNLALLSVIPLITLALVFTNEVHHLIWSYTRLGSSDPFLALDVEHGAWFWVHLAYSYLLLLLGSISIILMFFRTSRLYRRQSGALLFAVAVPWLGNAVYVLGLSPVPNLDLTPFAFTLSGVALAWGLLRLRLLDLVPVAYDVIIEHMRDGVVVVDSQGRIVDLNPAAQRILDISISKALGRSIARIMSTWNALIEKSYRDGEVHEEVKLDESSGRRGDYELTFSVLQDRRGRQTGCLILLHDITERKRAEDEIRQFNQTLEARVAERTSQLETAVGRLERNEQILRQSEERFRSLVQNASDIIMILQADGTVRYASPAVERMLGYPPEEMAGTRVSDLIHPDDMERTSSVYSKALDNPGVHLPVEFRIPHADGSWRYLESTVNNMLDDPSVKGIVVNSRDITERKGLEEQLTYQAFHDELTGLPNRALFMDRLQHALSRLGRYQQGIAVLYLDLDNFKVVNDSLGHEAGDRLLLSVAERLRASLRPGDTIARLGGDEFTVLLENVQQASGAVYVAERLAEMLRTEPFTLEGHEVFVTASMGITLSNSSDDQPADLLRDADLAMYQAKGGGRSRHEVFEPSMNVHALERLRLEGDLRQAIERGELRIYYQPKALAESGRIVAMEALARWEHPKHGLLSPQKFISLAEDTGLIVPLGRYVLRQACLQTREWQERYPDVPPLMVAVNLSARQFQHPRIHQDIAEILRETGLDPHDLTLEITESVAMENALSTITALKDLKALGVQVAIDDFGTGYSSLSYLRRFTVDSLKIDRSFIRGIEHDPRDRDLVWGMVTLGHALGLKVTAEGVETEEQFLRLQKMGCDMVQGYYFSRPLPSEAVSALLGAQGRVS